MLTGHRVVVVGATGTIGRSIVSELLVAGSHVLATGRDAEMLAAIEHAGADVLSLSLLPTEGCVQILRSACAATFDDRVDGLVLATGVHGPIGPTRALPAEALSTYLMEHFVSLIAIVGALAPLLDAARSPSIVALSGGGATGPRPNYTAYAAAKVALIRALENLALEEPRWRVNAVAPGFIASKIHESSIAADRGRSGEDTEAIKAKLQEADDPRQVARLVSLLLSDETAGLTGRLISAVWDDWDSKEWRREVARHPTLARLRRDDRFDLRPQA